jgi:eukaryotic-like serine/threonine-protein kinase
VLAPGTRIGPYEVADKIGVGGMGVVYRATDTNLGRQVAIKVLPDTVATDTERLARFDREARTLAALNHPNIAAIYGLERTGATTALVMELVEGPRSPVASRKDRFLLRRHWPSAGRSPRRSKRRTSSIVHRDLKPANVKLRPPT